MVHYEKPEDLPDDVNEIQDGDTFGVGGATFGVIRAEEFDVKMLRASLVSVLDTLQNAVTAFDRLARTNEEKVNVVGNVALVLHEWSHMNMNVLDKWAEGAAEKDTVAKAEEILRETR